MPFHEQNTGPWKIFEKSQFFTLYGYQKDFVSHFFLVVRSTRTFDMKYNLDWQKNAGSTNLLSSLNNTLLSLKGEFWPIFKLKIGQNSHFKINNFFLAEIEGSLTTRFFCHFKLYLMSKVRVDRTNRKKSAKQNPFCNHTR